MTFWGTLPNPSDILKYQTDNPNSVFWKDGVSFGFPNKPLGFIDLEPSSSWLPSDWVGEAVFIGWNRWGQPVVKKEDSSMERWVRRGPRAWSNIKKENQFCGDALWLDNPLDLSSTATALQSCGILPNFEFAQKWLTSIGYPINSFSPPVDTPPLVKTSQRPYLPLSEQSHNAFVPDGLSEPTIMALNNWKSSHSESMDTFVSRETGVNISLLSGEQVDAVGLAIDAIQKPGKSFLLGDQTGLGKGRILASLAMWAQKNHLTPVFFTERPNLFDDFWRDLTDVSGNQYPFSNAFICHQSAKISSPSGVFWKSPFTSADRQKSIISCELPPSSNFVLTVYSQFNRKDSAKIAFFKKIAPHSLFIFDEAHSATGQSNIQEAISEIVPHAKAAVYSSATFGKNVDHIVFHNRLLPQSQHFFDWSYWLNRSDARPLLSSLSHSLVKSGLMVRREQDMSALSYKIHSLPDDQQQTIDSLMDSFASFVSSFWNFQKQLSHYPKKTKSDPLHLWGGKLYRLNRLMFLAASADFMASTAADLHAKKIKPVIVCENTLEQALLDDENGAINSSWTSFAEVLFSEVSESMLQWYIL
jgi:hypothetical protein